MSKRVIVYILIALISFSILFILTSKRSLNHKITILNASVETIQMPEEEEDDEDLQIAFSPVNTPSIFSLIYSAIKEIISFLSGAFGLVMAIREFRKGKTK